METTLAPEHPCDEVVKQLLRDTYEEVRWLAARPGVTVGMARAWYVGQRADKVRTRIRRFTGQVSEKAVASGISETLVLEHHRRLAASISRLIERHIASAVHDPDDFVRTVLHLEEVHIVVPRENVVVRGTDGDYAAAGIVLTRWEDIGTERQTEIWQKVLKGKVANANAFRPAR